MIEPNITVSSMMTDNDVKLFCWLSGFTPEKIIIKWYEDEKLFKEEKPPQIFKISKSTQKEYYALSQIITDAQKWNKGTEFKCEATHQSKAYHQTLSKCKGQFSRKKTVRNKRSFKSHYK